MVYIERGNIEKNLLMLVVEVNLSGQGGGGSVTHMYEEYTYYYLYMLSGKFQSFYTLEEREASVGFQKGRWGTGWFEDLHESHPRISCRVLLSISLITPSIN